MHGFFISPAIPASEIEELLTVQPSGVLKGIDLSLAERCSADSGFMNLV